MAAQWFRARVADKQMLASKFLWVHLELVQPDRIEFTAGQYIMMRVPFDFTSTSLSAGAQGKPGFEIKHYSICSPPSMNHGVELLVDIGPQGLGSRYLQGLKPGDFVEFMAPAGRFVVATEKELWFVATGSGISAIRSMILDLVVDRKDARTVWLHWGLRYPEDVFWFTEWAQLTEEYDNFTFDPVLSKPSGGWKFCEGHVTECVMKHHFVRQPARLPYGTWPAAGAAAYLCGNKGMIAEVSKILQDKGMPKEMIHSEEYYG